MTIKKIFGNNVRKFRKKHKYTQEQLAELIDITPQHLGVIERGDAFVSADLLEKMVEVLEVSAPSFFYSDDDIDNNSLIQKIDKIVKKELKKASVQINKEIREI